MKDDPAAAAHSQWTGGTSVSLSSADTQHQKSDLTSTLTGFKGLDEAAVFLSEYNSVIHLNSY